MVRLQQPVLLPLLAYGEPDRGFETARVTSPFGWRNGVFHGAIDIGNERLGDKVIAAADGLVVAEGYVREPWSQPTNLFPSGNYGGIMVVLRHRHDVHTIYAHLDHSLVSVGDTVAQGYVIGAIGQTGSAAPPPLGGGGHLHFGVQAHPEDVPDGVRIQATPYGIGWDVDPWPVIRGVELAAPTWQDQLAERVIALRRAHPAQADKWREATGLTKRSDGKPLSRIARLRAEKLYLQTFDD